MQIIKLPSILPGNLDLAAVNQQLRQGTAQLDWSAVVSASEKHLALLLDKLDLEKDTEVLGIEGTIADNIADAIVRVMDCFVPRNDDVEGDCFVPRNDVEGDCFVPRNDDVEGDDDVGTALLSPPTPAEIRAELEEAILNDLLGPAAGEEEEIDEAYVSDRYLVGLLAPKFRRKTADEQPEQQDELALADKGNTEEGTTEGTTPPPNTMFPSSMGMTFCVSGKVKIIQITANWGKYEREPSKNNTKEDGKAKQVWKRYPIRGVCTQTLVKDKEFDWVVDADRAPDVRVQGQIRAFDEDWLITLFLVNYQTEPAKLRDKAWLFQPQLSVTSADANYPDIFIRKPLPQSLQNLDPKIQVENQAMAMLYRHQVEFAIGHGVSINAETAPNTTMRAVRISTRVVPAYSVPKTTPPTVDEIPELRGTVLDMKVLAETKPEDLPQILNPIAIAYSTWIDRQEKRITNPAENLAAHQEAAKTSIDNCKRTLQRIQEGIAILQTDSPAADAFQFMNRAMWQQRIHSLYSEEKRQGKKVDLHREVEPPLSRSQVEPGNELNRELTEIDIPKNRSWYPFQLAFILLNLPGITDLNHSDRTHPTDAICDLLWFPTGGGKTEAYLGLTAYTIALRRLQGTIAGYDGERGVAVLMRYTLRLLTLQQFQRATALICACEFIRRQDEIKWGKELFRIGLWVGQNSTPNYTSQSEEFTKQKRDRSFQTSGGSPHQLTNCPWCGTKIDPGKHIQVETVEKGRGRTIIKCGDSLGRCIFSKGEGLPVLVVDEEIYRRLPTLLIATVDKFAQMPWKGEVQMLFGYVNGYCDRHGFRSPEIEDSDRHNKTNTLPAAKTVPHPRLRPPDLIIQDELHLISGPLGTLVGLYETAVDRLATWEVNGKQVRPKVIASTATIRQAQTQVHSLFLRQVQVFPPQGLDIQDNFFSRQRQPSELYAVPPLLKGGLGGDLPPRGGLGGDLPPRGGLGGDLPPVPPLLKGGLGGDLPHFGRRYIGICAPGRRLKAALIRVYVATLAASQFLYEKYGSSADPWMTLVGYFNSLRELGGTRRLVDDDIRSRLGKMDRRGLAKRTRLLMDELTSRKDSTEIPDILDWLETPFDPQQEAENKALRKASKRVEKRDPLDVILATNMISVGVDVKRLGVMVACGQPKNTAEYIQATSRVGRTFPGLVITVYNWARPRDLSHYERFEHYHATFYQNVEALSVTPFASGALYRGLTALLVSLVRLSGTEFNKNDRAGQINRNHPYVQAAIEAIVQRSELVGDVQTGNFVRDELETKVDKWLTKAETLIGGGTLKYKANNRDGTTIELLATAGRGEWQDFTCLNSLRNVEPTVGLILTDEPPDEDFDRLPHPMHVDS